MKSIFEKYCELLKNDEQLLYKDKLKKNKIVEIYLLFTIPGFYEIYKKIKDDVENEIKDCFFL